jgi:hypothetical protein
MQRICAEVVYNTTLRPNRPSRLLSFQKNWLNSPWPHPVLHNFQALEDIGGTKAKVFEDLGVYPIFMHTQLQWCFCLTAVASLFWLRGRLGPHRQGGFYLAVELGNALESMDFYAILVERTRFATVGL